VARAAPEARAGGNIRPRGAVSTLAPPGAPLRTWRDVRDEDSDANRIARTRSYVLILRSAISAFTRVFDALWRVSKDAGQMLRDALPRNAPQHEEESPYVQPLHATTRHGLYAPRKTYS
jgi:hypothetical protein